jgi:predicted nucleotidyltransferase
MNEEVVFELKERMKIQGITKPLLNRYVEFLKEFFGDDLMSVAVYGSLARGGAKFPGSDIDLLIVIKGIEKISFGERLKQTMKVEKKYRKQRNMRGSKTFLDGLRAFRR